MPGPALLQIHNLISDFRNERGIDVSSWQITVLSQSCMVSGIRNSDQAIELTRYLKAFDLTSEVLHPTDHVSTWSVVAIESADPAEPA